MRKKIYSLLVVIVIVGALGVVFWDGLKNADRNQEDRFPSQENIDNEIFNGASKDENFQASQEEKLEIFSAPLDRSGERVAKKPFGIFITPQNSPVQPEKFSGFHTGTDFEIFPEEEKSDVSVRAVCSGRIEMKKYATGYGGVAVQSCFLDGEDITVVYGHLKLNSIRVKVGDELRAGDEIGILGAAYSPETSGERKHLHLGFHRGKSFNILGYVQNKDELSGWIDPCQYVCQD